VVVVGGTSCSLGLPIGNLPPGTLTISLHMQIQNVGDGQCKTFTNFRGNGGVVGEEGMEGCGRERRNG